MLPLLSTSKRRPGRSKWLLFSLSRRSSSLLIILNFFSSPPRGKKKKRAVVPFFLHHPVSSPTFPPVDIPVPGRPAGLEPPTIPLVSPCLIALFPLVHVRGELSYSGQFGLLSPCRSGRPGLQTKPLLAQNNYYSPRSSSQLIPLASTTPTPDTSPPHTANNCSPSPQLRHSLVYCSRASRPSCFGYRIALSRAVEQFNPKPSQWRRPRYHLNALSSYTPAAPRLRVATMQPC